MNIALGKYWFNFMYTLSTVEYWVNDWFQGVTVRIYISSKVSQFVFTLVPRCHISYLQPSS